MDDEFGFILAEAEENGDMVDRPLDRSMIESPKSRVKAPDIALGNKIAYRMPDRPGYRAVYGRWGASEMERLLHRAISPDLLHPFNCPEPVELGANLGADARSAGSRNGP